MPTLAWGRVLIRSLKRPIVIVALLALLFAQAAAGLHAVTHLKAGGDPRGLPGSHSQLCLACASFAPLASAHGGTATSLTVASLGVAEFLRPHDDTAAGLRHQVSFRARAPPR